MVGLKVISGFKGVIDYYYYMGQPCARTWPRKPKRPRSPAVQETIAVFKQAALSLSLISPEVRLAYEQMAVGTNLTWKDIFYRGYISGTLRYYIPVDELESSNPGPERQTPPLPPEQRWPAKRKTHKPWHKPVES